MGVLDQGKRIPGWLNEFLGREYFSHCPYHSQKKNERHYFCTDCVEGPLCRIGLQEHNDHTTLQVRRASHMDAVRVHDVENLVDIANIQTYSINGAKIVFLLCRSQHKVVKNAPHLCFTCGRPLPENLMYCCISCKLASIYAQADASATLCFPDINQKENLDRRSTTYSSSLFCSSDQGRRAKTSSARPTAFEVHPKESMCCSSQRSSVDQLQRPPKKRKLETTSADEDYELTRGHDHQQRHENSLFELCHYPRTLSEIEGEESSFNGMDLHVGRHFIKRWEGFRVRRRKGNPHRSPFL